MAALLSAATANTNRASATGTATGANKVLIEIPGDVVFGGAEVFIEGSSVNTAGKFSPFGRLGAFKQPMNIVLDLPTGHFVRAALAKAGSTTSVTVNMIDIT